MMNQGGNTEALAPAEAHLLENQYGDASQLQSSSFVPPATGSEAVAWTIHRVDNSSTENGIYSNPTYQYDQSTQPPARSIQDGLTAAPVAGNLSSLGTANVPQDYNTYTSYPSSSNPYGYGSTGYSGYYNSYQQQPNYSYSQPVGAYQNTGAPYQPISSFQNTGSYAASGSYSSTYYNPGDYQTSGGYQSSSYGNQSTLWNNGSYPNHSSHQYTNYTPATTGAYGSGTVPSTSLQYQQHYKQWADYYSQTEVSCAPGTENTSVSSASNLGCPIPGITSGYATPNTQPLPSYASSWGPDSGSSSMPSLQPGAVISGAHDEYWKQGAQKSQIHHTIPIQPNFQKPLDLKSSYDNFQDQHKTAPSHGPNLQYATAQQMPQNYQSRLQASPSLDTRTASKLQIPTNPRIASNLTVGFPKIDKDNSTTSAAAKPAYISVSMPEPDGKVLSNDEANSLLKPGMFPKSLRSYVEKVTARCKDDIQMAACQAVMKKMITKATADGTLYTRNWDMEPLFPIPNADLVNKDSECSTLDSSLPKHKRSPSRRSKSRWEPLPEEKLVDKTVPINNNNVKYSGWLHDNERNRKMVVENAESKVDRLRNTKFSPLVQKNTGRTPQRAFKKQRLADGSNSNEYGDTSSDSDKEQNLMVYHSGAMALMDSPEERKKRENRSKRFDKGQRQRVESNHFRPRNFGAGNLYTRRTSSSVLSKNFDDSSSRAVEDIDWDALTVKGSCQEIEKRYLRLTSVPDPATVRPEEVLTKALLMVQNSQKNYLYKCDQLKSIRQDLTVQRIRNQLTVKVYETHARLAIEVGDLPEYNQCQSQLKTLYAEGVEGCHMEFAAYNLLCVILHSNNNRDLLSSMSRLSDEAKKQEAVKHALAVRAAVTSGNYVMFFRLYQTAPNLNTCLMDLYVEKMRYNAVNCMCRSYRPTVPVSYVAQVLGFSAIMAGNGGSDEKDTDAMEECIEWLKAHGAIIIADNDGDMILDAKASCSSLYMPEPEDAVTHGDANLAVNDFLARTSL
ncbi:SAC3 family protein A [Quillaja saponaria]|uniref:SAC3 family protein A n=1 Tax=Quillaja saponaria TaxID=32244 RepID=A0AAD7Q7F2_QUISA|nr:SAC3 family protein A [Quillaja saponaria]